MTNRQVALICACILLAGKVSFGRDKGFWGAVDAYLRWLEGK